MHELGIMYKVVEQVLDVVKEHHLTEVEAIVLSLGKESGVVPSYLHACYPATIDGTMLAPTRLEIEVTDGDEFSIKEIRAR
ncbi:MAG: hydrogenase maturation nickel metallochaperone HypA [Defluviitaleaceae bacterium]|nr:hydrogenase maturation nickel metallochaperone HypA [Defluviitaleaceae bacterium]